MGSISSYYPLRFRKIKVPKKVYFVIQNQPLDELNTILNSLLYDIRIYKNQSTGEAPNLLKLFNKILPQQYFGTSVNKKLFFIVIRKILQSNLYECIFKSLLTKDYDLSAIHWLINIEERQKVVLLQNVNIFLLDRVIKPLILFHYKPLRTYKNFEIKLVARPKHKSFEDKIFNQLLIMDDLGFKKNPLQNSSILHLVPKGGLKELKYRPLATPKLNTNYLVVRILVQRIRSEAAKRKKYDPIFTAWSNFVRTTNSKNIYLCRVDLVDAFGRISLKKLHSLIENSDSLKTCKDLIMNMISGQVVQFRSQTWLWKRGLLQGQPLSPALCELYLASYDKSNLAIFEKSGCFLHRTVDDYFFVSDNKNDINEFLNKITILGLNKSKTVISNDKVSYCGKIFDAKTKEVGTDFKIGNGESVRAKMRVLHLKRALPESCWERILKRAVNFCSNNNYFSKMELNTVFNTEIKVLTNFFNSMVLVGYKFDCAVQDLKYTIRNLADIVPVLKIIINKYCRKSLETINKNRGNYYTKKINFEILKSISYRAVFLVLRRRNEVYKHFINEIKLNARLERVVKVSGFQVKHFKKLPDNLAKVKLNKKCVYGL